MDFQHTRIPSEAPGVRLKSGIQISEFIRTKEAVFEINVDGNVEEENFNYYDPATISKDVLEEEPQTGFLEEDDDETVDGSPFERLVHKMSDISDGKQFVYKMIKKEGTDETVPKNATVMIHYNATAEYQDCPFDSTYLRNEPLKFRINSGEVVYGLDVAVSSMKLKEISYFVVKSEYAYGSMGCPPRIPPDAAILYKVQLLNIVNDAEAEKFSGRMNEKERENLTFDQMCLYCKAEREKGNNYFKLKIYGKAKSCYTRMINTLENFRLQNAEEEKIQQQMLLKAYLNVSICALKMNKGPLVITMCRAALDIDKKNAKALFRIGKAHRMLMDFDKAQQFLERARAIEPNNNEINSEIKSLQMSFDQSERMERSVGMQMFSSLRIGSSEESKQNIKKE